MHDNRLELATEFGATHTISSRKADVISEVARITGSTVDFAFDCTSSGQLITSLVELYEQERFPFDRLVKYYDMGDIEEALADSKSGEATKPILRMPT